MWWSWPICAKEEFTPLSIPVSNGCHYHPYFFCSSLRIDCFPCLAFRSIYKEPTLQEGFEDIVRIPFIPTFKDASTKQLYCQFSWYHRVLGYDTILGRFRPAKELPNHHQVFISMTRSVTSRVSATLLWVGNFSCVRSKREELNKRKAIYFFGHISFSDHDLDDDAA